MLFLERHTYMCYPVSGPVEYVIRGSLILRKAADTNNICVMIFGSHSLWSKHSSGTGGENWGSRGL